MDLLSAGMWRYPEATATYRRGSWWVGCGLAPPERVVPRGVRPDPDHDDKPMALPWTLHEVYGDLSLVATMPSEAEAAEHLAAYTRRVGLTDLCRHGLPLWHKDRPPARGLGGRSDSHLLKRSCVLAEVPESGGMGIRVAGVVRMITTLDAVADAHQQLQSRNPVGSRVLGDLLEWPVLRHASADTARTALTRGRRLTADEIRRLIRQLFDDAMRESGLAARMTWHRHHRPELALVAQTTVGLYVAEAIAHVGVVDQDRSLICAACGMPVQMKRAPRPGDSVYCRRPECQRERQRVNQARRRAKTAQGGHVG